MHNHEAFPCTITETAEDLLPAASVQRFNETK